MLCVVYQMFYITYTVIPEKYKINRHHTVDFNNYNCCRNYVDCNFTQNL